MKFPKLGKLGKYSNTHLFFMSMEISNSTNKNKISLEVDDAMRKSQTEITLIRIFNLTVNCNRSTHEFQFNAIRP